VPTVIEQWFENRRNLRMTSGPPKPMSGERPTLYADRVGHWYRASASDQHKKTLGQYLTPVKVAGFMAAYCKDVREGVLRVLDPGAGTGILSCALCEALAESMNGPSVVELDAYEIDTNLTQGLQNCLTYAKEWMAERGLVLHFTTHTCDFVIDNAQSLDSSQLQLITADRAGKFDFIICNPPYFKLQKTDPRAQAGRDVVHGQPNIYAIFMAVSAALLRMGGVMVFITPRSYTAGPYFRRFRELFFEKMRPKAFHLFGSRTDAFRRDEVLQENLILVAERCDGWFSRRNGYLVRISFSHGISDLGSPCLHSAPVAEMIDLHSKDKLLRIMTDDESVEVARSMSSWPGTLGKYGLEISTGPVVPFRAVSLLSSTEGVPGTHAPLLWMQHVTAMKTQWPVPILRKPQYIVVNAESMPLLVANKNYVLLRRFSSKEQHRRLTASPLPADELGSQYIGLENHLNYIHRPGGTLTQEELYGLAALLNSSLLDMWFRTSSGNTQVSATELRAMPLPPLGAIEDIGRWVLASSPDSSAIDEAVEGLLIPDAVCASVPEVAYG
jgi:adenine-specific DNA-methyltransferase